MRVAPGVVFQSSTISMIKFHSIGHNLVAVAPGVGRGFPILQYSRSPWSALCHTAFGMAEWHPLCVRPQVLVVALSLQAQCVCGHSQRLLVVYGASLVADRDNRMCRRRLHSRKVDPVSAC
jgi:hypothetical protein